MMTGAFCLEDDATVHRIFLRFYLTHHFLFQSIVKNTKEEEDMQKPGWFHSSPEHHEQFMDIQQTMVQGLE
jgi:hypothetical protein